MKPQDAIAAVIAISLIILLGVPLVIDHVEEIFQHELRIQNSLTWRAQ